MNGVVGAMRANRLILGAAVVSVAALGACGTVTQGGTQTVDVVVKGSPSAWCEFSTPHFRNTGTFPNKVTLERSKDDLTAECKGEQNLYKKFVIPTRPIDRVAVGNAPTAFIGQAYDAGTGAMWEYPDPLIVDFRNADEGEGPKPAWPGEVTDQTRIGTAPIAPPMPVRMQPVMDEDLNPAMMTEPGQSGGTEVIDAVRLAVDGQPIAVTKTTTTVPAGKPAAARMKPIVSPEDDPAVLKAKQEARAKAAAEAKRKAAAAKAAAEEKAAAEKAAKEAAEAEAAAARAAEEAKEAAAAAEAAAASSATAAPATETPAETPPSDAALSAPATATGESAPASAPDAAAPETAPAQEPAPEAAPAPARSSEMPSPAQETAPASEAAPAEEKKSEMPPSAGQPANGQSTDMDKYLSGGQ